MYLVGEEAPQGYGGKGCALICLHLDFGHLRLIDAFVSSVAVVWLKASIFSAWTN